MESRAPEGEGGQAGQGAQEGRQLRYQVVLQEEHLAIRLGNFTRPLYGWACPDLQAGVEGQTCWQPDQLVVSGGLC